jgi:hypothetical protein
VAADHGSGELIAMANRVRTAADFQSEIPFPIYGLPDFSSTSHCACCRSWNVRSTSTPVG